MLESVTVSPEKNKPVFDEQTLAKLLEAAYILQEHGHELRKVEPAPPPRSKAPRTEEVSLPKAPAREFRLSDAPPIPSVLTPEAENEDYSTKLAQIVATQHEIEVRHLKGDEALSLIAMQLIETCGAAGASIGILAGSIVRYRAIAGIRALPVGSEVPMEKALCASCLRSGEVFSCADVDPQSRNDSGECRRRGIGSLIIVPVIRESEVAGALELYYSDPRAFSEQDVNTCQLMAGLVAEVLSADGGASVVPVASGPALVSRDNPNAHPQVSEAAPNSPMAVSAVCDKCGRELRRGEQFCGECGTPRVKELKPAAGIQSKPIPYWIQRRVKDTKVSGNGSPSESKQALAPSRSSDIDPAETSFSEVMARATAQNEIPKAKSAESVIESVETAENAQAGVEEETEVSQDQPDVSPDWSSAFSARKFLEQLAAGNRKNTLVQFWNARRGDIYLGIAVILVICAIRWGMWSNHPANAAPPANAPAAANRKPAVPELSAFDRMLISLGLAEAPEPAEDKGNPTSQVWIDLHTGLYYCAGADLYGKTSTGKYATQRDAELDQYQPAYRKACN